MSQDRQINVSLKSTFSRSQRDMIIQTLLSDRINNNLIEIDDNKDVKNQVTKRIKEIIEALTSLVNDKHVFYYLSSGFHEPGKLFRGLRTQGSKEFNIEDVKLFLLEFVHLEINRKIQETLSNAKRFIRQKWINYYKLLKKDLSKKTHLCFEQKKITSEEKTQIIDDLKKEAHSLQLEIIIENNDLTIHSKFPDHESKESKKKSEIKLCIPIDYFAVQHFYEHTIPRIYFPLMKYLGSLYENRIFTGMSLKKSNRRDPYVFDVTLPIINDQGKLTTLVLTSNIKSLDSIDVLLKNRIETFHTESSPDYQVGFLKIARYLSPNFEEKEVPPALKKLILNEQFYRLLERKKLNLSKLSDIKLNTVDLLILNSKEILFFLEKGILNETILKKMTPGYFKKLISVAIITKSQINAHILELLTEADIEILCKMESYTTIEDIKIFIIATAAIRKQEKPSFSVSFFQEVKNTVLTLETNHENLLNIIRKNILTLNFIEKSSPERLKEIIHYIEIIKNRDLSIQFLFVHGFITSEQLKQIPMRHSESNDLIPEIVKFISLPKNQMMSAKSLINNFVQLTKEGLLNESDLKTIIADNAFKNLLSDPKLNAISNPRLNALILLSLQKQIEFVLSFPQSVFHTEQVSEDSINNYFNILLVNCKKRELKIQPELIIKARFALPLIDSLYQLTRVSKEWEEECTSENINNYFNDIIIHQINMNNFKKFIHKFEKINWTNASSSTLETLQKDMLPLFELETKQTAQHSFQQYETILDLITNKNFMASLHQAIQHATQFESAFSKTLYQLNKLINNAEQYKPAKQGYLLRSK